MDTAAGKAGLIKVPVVITFCFWMIKILATTVGETGADFLIFKLKYGLIKTTLLMTLLLAIILTAQIRAQRYIPALYWVAVVMLSIVGTLITDTMTDKLGIPLTVSAAVFAVVLPVVFWCWYRAEKNLSIHSIDNRQRELFYWLAVLVAFALGTAMGDWVTESIGIGYLPGGIAFGLMIALVAAGYYGLGLGAVTAFWSTYILTRPFGASMGDYLSHSARKGGLGLGTTNTSLVFLVIIALLVAYLTVSRRDSPVLVPSGRQKDD